jgi:hypothetical protein
MSSNEIESFARESNTEACFIVHNLVDVVFPRMDGFEEDHFEDLDGEIQDFDRHFGVDDGLSRFCATKAGERDAGWLVSEVSNL